MKSLLPFLLLTTSWQIPLHAQEDAQDKLPENSIEEIIERISTSSLELAEAQDELSADVMELVEDQTVPQVIELLEAVEKIMAEVTDDLAEEQTGGKTIAAQTEIIEKIFDAAKKKQQSSDGEGQPQESKESMGAMLDMMERMMGKEPSEQGKQGEQEGGEKPGEGSGGGSTGDSDTENEDVNGSSNGQGEERTVPRGSGTTGQSLPSEFRKLLDAYNRNDSE